MFAPPKGVPAPFRANFLHPTKQVCTHKAAISLSLQPVMVLVCTRISVHPSEWKSAPVILQPLGCRFFTLRGAEVLLVIANMNIWEFKCGTPIRKGASLLPKGAAYCDNLGCKLEPLFLCMLVTYYLSLVTLFLNNIIINHFYNAHKHFAGHVSMHAL